MKQPEKGQYEELIQSSRIISNGEENLILAWQLEQMTQISFNIEEGVKNA